MSNYKIIERRFPVQHFLTRKIFGEVSFGRSYEAYCQIVYFDEINPKVITAKLVYIQDWENEPEGFFNLIEEDLTFDEFLIASTLYFSHNISLIKQILSTPLNPIEDFLEHILKPTNGYLIYSFQFEHLAQLILGVTLDEAVRLRRVFNKQPNFVNNDRFDNEDNALFKRILKERCVTRGVHLPNYSGAKNLLVYARSIA